MASMDIIPLYGYLCNVVSTYQMHPLMNKEGTQHLYGWLELMVYHTSSKSEAERSVPVFIYLGMAHHWSGCMASNYMIPLLGCLSNIVSSSLMHSLMVWEGYQHPYGWLELMVMEHHAHQPRQEQEVCQFSLIHAGPSLECCVVSMNVTPLLGCLFNGVSTPHMHPLINCEGCQHMYGWLELMVHPTSSQARARSGPVFIH